MFHSADITSSMRHRLLTAGAIALDSALLTTVFSLIRHKARTCYLRAANYHWTPQEHESSLYRQFEYFSSAYHVLNASDLRLYFDGKLALQKPGLIISFDDGYNNQFEVAAPLLDAVGLPGWFFVIAKACDSEPQLLQMGSEQLATRFCMNWKHLDSLASRGHEIGCHPHTHTNVGKLDQTDLSRELIDSKQYLTSHTSATISSFCFPYGTAGSYSPAGLAIVKSHYEFVFHSFPTAIQQDDSPFSIGRIPLEPHWDLAMTRLRLSGVFDLRYRKELRLYSNALARLHD